jgi:hypothetical protein
MPFPLPREPTEQDRYRRRQQESFEATRRVAPPLPTVDSTPRSQDPIADLERLGRLHASGVLNDDEFSTAKARLLNLDRD